jgi:hypothetical protein
MNSERGTDLMTDKELLTFAAKAAGIELGEPSDGCYTRVLTNGQREFWNPLNDNGDALRLAVNRRIGIHYGNDDDVMAVTYDLSAVFTEKCGKDPCAATRRAIVRAAA